MWQAASDVYEPLALARRQTTFDKQEPILEHSADFLVAIFAFAGQTSRLFLLGRRSPTFQLGLALGQTLTLFGHRFEHPFGEVLDDMEGTKLMGYIAKDF